MMRTRDAFTIAVIAAVVLWGGTLIPSTLDCLAQREADHRAPRLEDVWIAAFACLLCALLRSLLERHVFVPWVAEWLVRRDKPSWTPAERREKVHKCATALFKGLCYHLPVSIYAYVALRDKVFLPSDVGGRRWPRQDVHTGPGARALYEGLPHHEIGGAVKMYYMVALGFALHSFLFHACLEKRRHDFWEMGLHHVVTVNLILFSYANALHRLGAIVLFLHDVPDIFVYLAKGTADSRFPNVCLIFYFGMVASWMWFRLWAFPYYVLLVVHTHVAKVSGCTRPTFGWLTAMLWLLLALHVWWFTIFVKMGYDALVKGITRDLQSQDQQLQRELRNKKGA